MPRRIPRLYAAASLKQQPRRGVIAWLTEYSAALCRGLIEALEERIDSHDNLRYSAALCRGLIEAPTRTPVIVSTVSYSAALCRGLIEAPSGEPSGLVSHPYSAALCRGLIEAIYVGGIAHVVDGRIPRLYAAASLKR